MAAITIKSPARRLTAAAVCLALCLVLPFLTGQIPQIGSALCPMHFPVLLAGFVCGPWWAAAVGAVAPLLRHALFGGMPPILTAIAMTFELATYGLIAGLMYGKGTKTAKNIYISLIVAMVFGRVIWGIATVIITGAAGGTFTWMAFASGAVLNAIPGILVQIVLIPAVVAALRKTHVIE